MTTPKRRLARIRGATTTTALFLALCATDMLVPAVSGFINRSSSSSYRSYGPSKIKRRRMPFVMSASSDSNERPSSGQQLPPPKPSEARLTIVQITDVYTLANFASLKTLLNDKRADLTPGSKVVSTLTGDFLAPYLLSSVDGGSGMMSALAATPIDYLTWGNHEADIDHSTVCRHVRQFPGKWLNSNMPNHDAMAYQLPYDVIEVRSEDGTNVRRIGLVAVLSDDPSLYKHFDAPGAFGGATIQDPWDTLRRYKSLLEDPNGPVPGGCDVVIPLQHMYCPDDHRTCREFDFPVVLSGHDHHVVDEVVEGTRLLKPGSDGIHATVLDLSWDAADSPRSDPRVNADFVEVAEWEADPTLAASCDGAYDALSPLRNTELSRVPPRFEPLSSVDSRGRVCTMGKFVCSLLRSAMNTSPVRQSGKDNEVDAVLLMGGNIRGGTDYPQGSFFSLEALEAEVKADEVVGVVPMPGWLLSEGVTATHSGDPIPGWVQYDEGVREAVRDGKLAVTHVGGQPIDMDRVYRVATKISDLTNGQSPPWTEYYTANPDKIPAKGAYVVNVHSELMGFFARNLGRKIWEAIALSQPTEMCIETTVECPPEERLYDLLDRDGDGLVTVDEIHVALRDVLGMSIDPSERSLAEFVHRFADQAARGDGHVTLRDFATFGECKNEQLDENQKWRLAFPTVGETIAGEVESRSAVSSLPLPAWVTSP